MTTTMKVSFLQRLFDVPLARCCPICHAPLSADEDEICSRCDSLLPRTDHLLHPYDNAMAQVYWGVCRRWRVRRRSSTILPTPNRRTPFIS